MKAKRKLLAIVLFATGMYVASFLIHTSYLATKISLLLSTFVLVCTIMLYTIKTKVKLFNDPLDLDIERKSFFGRAFYVLSIALIILAIFFQWISNLVLVIEVKSIYSMDFIYFIVCVLLFVIWLLIEMFRKSTIKYWQQIPYSKRIKTDMCMILLLLFAVLYDPRSFWSSLCSTIIVFVIVFVVLSFKRAHTLKVKAKKTETHYYDAFAKPNRSK